MFISWKNWSKTERSRYYIKRKFFWSVQHEITASFKTQFPSKGKEFLMRKTVACSSGLERALAADVMRVSCGS